MTPEPEKASQFIDKVREIVRVLRYGPRELALATLGLLLLAGRAEAGTGINGNGSVGVLSRVKHRMTDWLRDFF